MTPQPLVSVCMPLYNAGPYLAGAIEGVLAQTYTHLELVIADNCSTDGSFERAQQYAARDARVCIIRNRYNVGYAGNLDKVTSLARGELMMVHCADDLAEPTAIARMVAIFSRTDVDPGRTVVIADAFVTRGDGTRTYVLTRDPDGYRNRHVPLAGYRAQPPLDRFGGHTALADAMARLKTVGFQGAMLYPRALFEAIEGVRNGRLYNPDKHFTYKLLAQDPEVIWLHEPLFSWRVHGDNQDSVERAQGAIRKALDDYVYTFEYPQSALERWGVRRADMIRAFVDESCLARGLKEIAAGYPLLALRYLCFALATYPLVAVRNPKFWVGAAGLLTGPLGGVAARAGYRAGMWRDRRTPVPASAAYAAERPARS